MSPENARERTKKRRYTFVVIPGADSGKTRSVSVSRWWIVAAPVTAVLVVAALVVTAIVVTPIGTLLPISNPELEQRYSSQIVGIQEQLRRLAQEMVVLRSYNIKLRRALGERVGDQESDFLSGDQSDTSSKVTTDRISLGAEDTVSASMDIAVDRQVSVIDSDAEPTNRFDHVIQFPLVMPADGYVTRGFDEDGFHYGIDIAGRTGLPVRAAADGRVVFAGWTYDDGFTMMIAHGEGFLTVYKHNSSLLKTSGANVRRGELIALIGNTGKTSSGSHLHFEVWRDGVADDPGKYLLTTQ